jgi:acyl-coenzyme A synthetase/AMP-(fatty) acid ligase
VWLCVEGLIPKTTSGKIQRDLCRSMLAGEELEILAYWHAEEHNAP